MKVRVRGQGEAEAALEVQLKALSSSCTAFDNGDRWEAIRIATSVHTVVHDASKKQRSLLTLVGAKTGLKFLSSGSPINTRNMLASFPLTIIEVSAGGDNAGVRYLPKKDRLSVDHRWLPFSKWWQDDPVFAGPEGTSPLSRKNLTFALRNKEGGGHFDLAIQDASYVEMKEGAHWIVTDVHGNQASLREAELVTMRQVGWEVLETLKSRSPTPAPAG